VRSGKRNSHTPAFLFFSFIFPLPASLFPLPSMRSPKLHGLARGDIPVKGTGRSLPEFADDVARRVDAEDVGISSIAA